MELDMHEEIGEESHYCPNCGSDEDGFFCRSCGELLRDGEMVLCPRCRHVAPVGDFCNRCGQSLAGLALSLQQLSMAGDDFWVTGEAAAPASSIEPTVLVPDESVQLANGDLPDWLQELPTETAPDEVQEHIYPSLTPIEGERIAPRRNTAFSSIIILMFVLMLGLILLTVFLLLRGGG